MNFIKFLKEDNRVISEGLESLRQYVASSKFQGDGNDYVNIKDILLRLEEIQNERPRQ